jgi:hypothetical protein
VAPNNWLRSPIIAAAFVKITSDGMRVEFGSAVDGLR